MIGHFEALLEPKGYFFPEPRRCHPPDLAQHADQAALEPSGNTHDARRTLRTRTAAARLILTP
jgi:hypothetical protein